MQNDAVVSILVVDSEQEVIRDVESIFSCFKGCLVTGAQTLDVAAALAQTNIDPFDLYLIGACFTEKERIELLHTLKNISPRTPVVAMISDADGPCELLRAADFSGFLRTPFGSSELIRLAYTSMALHQRSTCTGPRRRA